MEPAALPLHWTINSQLELFEVVAEGDVDLAEANRMLDALVGSNALGYRKLFDGSLGDTQLSAFDILSIGVRIRALHVGSTLGPLAVVVPEDKHVLLSRVLGILASGRRPMRVFRTPDKARNWLESPAIRGGLSMITEGPQVPQPAQ